ncbi:MAG: hypothetical protein HY748_08000 [Elusimicrobia bacterium]|nr:hypothetical protein [Elusimicrobiota bacterium]
MSDPKEPSNKWSFHKVSDLSLGLDDQDRVVQAKGMGFDLKLGHVGLPTRFPKTKPARSPPAFSGDECQVDPGVDAWGGIDESPEPNWAAA